MLMREILNIVDPDRMTVRTFCDLFGNITLASKEERSPFLRAMYGWDLQEEEERLDLEKVRAEIAKLNAAALKDRVTAEREGQPSSNRPR